MPENGNRPGWTFDTAMITASVALIGVITWVRTGRQGDAKAVDVALVGTTKALGKTSADTDRQFEGVRMEIKELAKAQAEGTASLATAIKLVGVLAAIAAIIVGVVGLVYSRGGG